MMKTRWMEKRDLEAVVEIERLSHPMNFAIEDCKDTVIETTQPWAWTSQDLVTVASEYENTVQGRNDTRIRVCEASIPLIDSKTNETFEVDIVVGAMCYEIMPDGFDIIMLSASPKATTDSVRRKLVDFIRSIAADSPKRRKLVAHVPDGDWTTLKFFQSLKWGKAKLLPYYYDDGRDAWYLECQNIEQKTFTGKDGDTCLV
jgi:hypothetical protein